MAEVNTPDAIPATNASNTTRYFNLPLFIASDKPSWLVDWNGAMGQIDSILEDIATASEGAVADVQTIQTQIDALNAIIPNLEATVQTAVEDVAAMQTTVDSHETRMDSIESDLITQNNLIKTLSDSVVAMQATVATLNNRVAAMETTVGGLDVDVAAINTELSTIRSTMSSLDSRVTALENAGSGASGGGYRNDASFITSSATVSGRTAVFALNSLGENDSAQVTLYYGSGGTIKLAYLPFGSSDALTDSNCFLVDSSGNAGSITVTFTGPGQIFADGSGVVTIRYDIHQA